MTGQPYEQDRPAHPYGPPPGYPPPPPYGPPPGYGYGPGYGYAWAVPPAPPAWPAGPGRPGVATAAAVLGFVTGGLTLVVSLFLLALTVGGEGDPATTTLLGLPCAAGLVSGGVRLLGRRSPLVLSTSALAAVVVLFLALVAAAGTLDADDVEGLVVVLVLALPLPVLTAVFSRLPATVGWASSRP
ncbi:hypothetical protein JOD57_002383 [Geodermatophilus bullaregiensis]|uniref:hypothetical protein n=1 Tax=Geodermatophilus bullaregiensis TaxID=1564160 RepID=UPI0019580FF3|nr:hypothetical protein [Geodermatophilus bullaregiensis]MBM7806546.1 hypothetical protein [Geodermatophilus bullaregiensis]